MAETRARLLERKRDIYEALRILDDDHQGGAIDQVAYERSRQRYEHEAAEILRRLDALHETSAQPSRKGFSMPLLFAGGAVVIVGAALALFLTSSLGHRTSSQALTGSGAVATAVPPTNPTLKALNAAQRAVKAHPNNVNDLLRLGNDYLDVGDPDSADTTFVRAMEAGPRRPEPQTLHAMLLASRKQTSAALRLLHNVERQSPTYARAWLLDGLIAARMADGYSEAMTSWKHFLALVPKGPVADEVRQFVASIRRTQEKRR